MDESADSFSLIGRTGALVSGKPLVCPRLPPEYEDGSCIEHKLQLLGHGQARFEQLVTQLRWRLREGAGSARYIIGVADDGDPLGLVQPDMDISLQTLKRMCYEAGAFADKVQFMHGHSSDQHLVAFVDITVHSQTCSHVVEHPCDVRVAVIGVKNAGKSTLIGTLVNGELDDGDGSARLLVARHRHEIEKGGTSSLSRHLIPFDVDGRRARDNSAIHLTLGAADVLSNRPVSSNATDRTVTLIDLAGDARYRRSMLSGLLGSLVDSALLVVSLDDAADDACLSETRCLAMLLRQLRIPYSVVMTKVDKTAEGKLMDAVTLLRASLQPVEGILTGPHIITSCVTGAGLAAVYSSIYRSPLRSKTLKQRSSGSRIPETVFAIQDFFVKGDRVILGGTCFSGTISRNMPVSVGLIGNSMISSFIESVHRDFRNVDGLDAGQSGSISIQVSGGVDPATYSKAKLLTSSEFPVNSTSQLKIECDIFDWLEVSARVVILFMSVKDEGVILSTERIESERVLVTIDCEKKGWMGFPGLEVILMLENKIVGGKIV